MWAPGVGKDLARPERVDVPSGSRLGPRHRGEPGAWGGPDTELSTVPAAGGMAVPGPQRRLQVGRGLGQSCELRAQPLWAGAERQCPRGQEAGAAPKRAQGWGVQDSTPARSSLQPRGGGACACSSRGLGAAGAAGDGSRLPSPSHGRHEDDPDPEGKGRLGHGGQDAWRPAPRHHLAPFQCPLREGVPRGDGVARCRSRSPGSVSSRGPGDRPFPDSWQPAWEGWRGSLWRWEPAGRGVGGLAGPAPHPGRGAGRLQVAE